MINAPIGARVAPRLPPWVVCPRCQGALDPAGDGVTCHRCAMRYERHEGALQLLADPADRFADNRQDERDAQDEGWCRHTTLGYLLPVLRRLLGTPPPSSAVPRILSAGCGIGLDVDLLTDHGFDAYGVDCGERVWTWARRQYPERLYVANVKSLPFAAESFDFVAAGCLLPHVGVVGDTTSVKADVWEQRRQAAREMIRVVKPGGYILLASPNRRCPVDAWHLHDNPHGVVRLHGPREPFLLSVEDHRRLFLGEGCRHLEIGPLANYFFFGKKSRHPWQRFLVAPVRGYFGLLSAPRLESLRASALNPFLIVLVQK